MELINLEVLSLLLEPVTDDDIATVATPCLYDFFPRDIPNNDVISSGVNFDKAKNQIRHKIDY